MAATKDSVIYSTQVSIRVGTRGSALALWQANHVARLLQKNHPNLTLSIVPIHTAGDNDKTTPLSELGGKGVFIRSLENALLRNEIDIAVHSLKDVTSHSPDGLSFFAFLPAESICDALIVRQNTILSTSPLDDLPTGYRIGTGSMRRIALLAHRHPHLCPIPIRGNIESRMQKIFNGDVDAVLLSEAGIKRMGVLPGLAAIALAPESFVPAPGQGVIAIQGRRTDKRTQTHVNCLINPLQTVISESQLSILTALGFDCRDPFGLRSIPKENKLEHSLFLERNGKYFYKNYTTACPATQAECAHIAQELQ